jgi:hypothetical protein
VELGRKENRTSKRVQILGCTRNRLGVKAAKFEEKMNERKIARYLSRGRKTIKKTDMPAKKWKD